MEKKNKKIKICVFGGLTALALTGTMVLCNDHNYKDVKLQESSISTESKEKIEHVLEGYDENVQPIYKTVVVGYDENVQPIYKTVVVGYDKNGKHSYKEQVIESSSKTR